MPSSTTEPVSTQHYAVQSEFGPARSGELTEDHLPSMGHDGSTTELIHRYRTGRGRSTNNKE